MHGRNEKRDWTGTRNLTFIYAVSTAHVEDNKLCTTCVPPIHKWQCGAACHVCCNQYCAQCVVAGWHQVLCKNIVMCIQFLYLISVASITRLQASSRCNRLVVCETALIRHGPPSMPYSSFLFVLLWYYCSIIPPSDAFFTRFEGLVSCNNGIIETLMIP